MVKAKILGLAGKAIFILMKQVAACMPAIQNPGWIVSHHPVFDDERGYRCLGVSREQDVMPQAKTHNEVKLCILTIEYFSLGNWVAGCIRIIA
jgi:hypothetical protein